jgi:hypothetical protein
MRRDWWVACACGCPLHYRSTTLLRLHERIMDMVWDYILDIGPAAVDVVGFSEVA